MAYSDASAVTRSRARAAILVVDLLIVLFPPLQWAFSAGAMSLWYYVAVTVLVTLSLFALWALRDREGVQ